jgi:hypothetical protein
MLYITFILYDLSVILEDYRLFIKHTTFRVEDFRIDLSTQKKHIEQKKRISQIQTKNHVAKTNNA